jgi:hypothetical protein
VVTIANMCADKWSKTPIFLLKSGQNRQNVCRELVKIKNIFAEKRLKSP